MSENPSELDELLEEYQTPQPAVPVEDIKELANYVREDKQDKHQQSVNESLSDAASFIGDDDALKDIPESTLNSRAEDFLHGEARRDKSIETAFNSRDTNPAGWNAARDGIKARFIERETGESQSQTAEDVAAAKASVRGLSPTPPEDTGPYRNSKKEVADIGSMSDQEFQNYKAKVFAGS
jgi:hypothetical protein